MKYGEVAFVAFFIAGCVCCRADNARFCIHVVDERTGLPLSGMRFRGVFIERFLRWENAVIDHDFTGETNQKGDYAAAGKTNCGEAGFRLCGNNGFYDTKFVKVPFDLSGGKPMPIFQWWRPDNQVVTVELQRVEHPIPLWVKNAKLKMKPEEAAGYDGTNAVWRYDLMVGDWLPPAGQGKVPDLVVAGNYRFDGMVDGVSKFSCYEYSHSIEFPGKGNGVFENLVQPQIGIKVRRAPESGYERSVKGSFGRKKILYGVNIFPKLYSDEDANRCYVFRVRSRYDEKGNLVEAYYGKIYGDFSFKRLWDVGGQQPVFLYYLNPTSLDRNLEWDMKNNLCPNSGSLGQLQP